VLIDLKSVVSRNPQAQMCGRAKEWFAGGVGGLVSFEGMLGARTLRCWPEKA
jgi:hypothetical protein